MTSDDPRPHATLRPEHAFVVQFDAATRVDTRQLEGRVEHLVSRHATRFHSLEALLGFIGRVLREVRDAHSTEESWPLARWPQETGWAPPTLSGVGPAQRPPSLARSFCKPLAAYAPPISSPAVSSQRVGRCG